MKQDNVAFSQAARRVRKREFLDSMDRVVPRPGDLVALIESRTPRLAVAASNPAACR